MGEHRHLRYLYKESFTSGKTFTMSMFDTLLYQSYSKPYLPELLKLILGLTYSYKSAKLCTYRIDSQQTIGMTYGELYKELCGGESLHGNVSQPNYYNNCSNKSKKSSSSENKKNQKPTSPLQRPSCPP